MLKTLIKIRFKGLFARSLKTTKNKKIGIGKIILFTLLFAYVGIAMFIMFGVLFDTLIEPLYAMGIPWVYFAIMSLMTILLCFVGSVFITHHEIYEGKDNELLMSMPITNRDILLSRICVILILNYIYESLIALPAEFIYVLYRGVNVLEVIMFILMFLTLPLFVLAISCLFGWILAHILVHIRKKNLMVIVLYLLFLLGYFKVIYSIEGYIQWLVQNGHSFASAIERGLFPLYHLGIAMAYGQIGNFLIYIVCMIVPFVLVVYILSKNFIRLATTKPKIKKVAYQAKPMHVHSIQKTLLIREFKHFTSNAMVMLNGTVGVIFSIVCIGAVILNLDTIQEFLRYIPELKEFLVPILCMIGISINSLNVITSSLISLEGNHLWIIKSLPIDTKDIILSKLNLHLLLCIPSGILLSLVLSFAFSVNIWGTFLIVLAPIIFTCFIAIYGLLLNLWKPKFDWVNETACVKQSLPVILTTFTAMGLSFVLCLMYIVLFVDIMSIELYMYGVLIVFIMIDILLFYLLMTWGTHRLNQL